VSELTLRRLREVAAYDPITGQMTAKTHRGRKGAGSPLGSLHSNDYLSAVIDGKRYFVHRLAWFLATGSWPAAEIDHINGVRTDNRLINLRQATRKQNAANFARQPGSSGFLGVSWSEPHKKYRAVINHSGRQRHLGWFDNPDEAANHYRSAAIELRGQFVRGDA